ncbi:POK11 protein, partial [Nothocercus nigrocapillus]|nr:POK11 protein [Nothocercus nigrocapillus]
QHHMWAAMMASGVPHEVKTNNGPCYISKNTEDFFRLWGIAHVTGIPHSPTGQAIVEHMNQT